MWNYSLWKEWTDWAREYYGPNVHTVELETGSEYNDEGGYYATIESVLVSDANGNALYPDPESPGCKELIAKHPAVFKHIESFDDMMMDHIRETYDEQDRPADDQDSAFVVDRPPVRQFPVLYVEE
jgi:hypothetical protein